MARKTVKTPATRVSNKALLARMEAQDKQLITLATVLGNLVKMAKATPAQAPAPVVVAIPRKRGPAAKPVQDETGRIFKSVSEAASFHGISTKANIYSQLKGRVQTVGGGLGQGPQGHTFRYVNN